MRVVRRRVLGLSVAIASSHQAVLEVARAALNAWPRTHARPDIRIRVDVMDVPAVRDPASMRYDIRGTVLRIAGPDVLAHADSAKGRARIRVGESALSATAAFRYGVLEAALLFLATARDRVPFHAAGLVRAGRAALLAGPSGAGKSTLALAALRRDRDWRLLSEDCLYLEEARRRVWGWPGFVHVSAGAVRFFRELDGDSPVLTAAGKRKLAVKDEGAAVRRTDANAAVVLILQRTSEGPGLVAMPETDARARLCTGLEPGFDRFSDAFPSALGPLVRRVWRFDPGPDPDAAIAFLESALPDLVDAPRPPSPARKG